MAARKKAGGELADANKTLSALVHRVEGLEGDRESMKKLHKDLVALQEKLQAAQAAKEDEDAEPPEPPADPPPKAPPKAPPPAGRWGFDAWAKAGK